MKEKYKEQAQLLANYLPSGKFWEAKNIDESNLRKLLNGFGKEFVNIEDTLNWLKRELNILTTFDLIEYWEEAYGIPDDDGVFTVQGKSIEERRFNLYIKELMDGADRAEDWENIASKFGYKCKVYPPATISYFTFRFPINFYESPQYAIGVEFYDIAPPPRFDLQFPFTFGATNVIQLQKIFEIIKPADCEVVYRYVNS